MSEMHRLALIRHETKLMRLEQQLQELAVFIKKYPEAKAGYKQRGKRPRLSLVKG